MADIARYSLDWLIRQIRRTRVNIARAEEKYGNVGGCAGCAELADLELKVQINCMSNDEAYRQLVAETGLSLPEMREIVVNGGF